MIWRHPAAWLGLVTLVVPILVHLLGRRRPVPLPFPTLRFLDRSEIVPARRHRLNDLPLLVMRLAILTAAVTALAGPVFVAWRRQPAPTIARAIVVDTSSSMSRMTPRGRPARDEARERVQSLSAGDVTTRVIEGDLLASAVATAATWLADQPGRRDLVVISDFQLGALDGADLVALPADVGMNLARIETVALQTVPGPAIAVGGRTFVSRLVLGDGDTRVTWTPAPAGWQAPSPLATVAGPAERQDADAALEAAAAEGVPASASDRLVAVIFPSAPERAAIAAAGRPPGAPWMFDVMNALYGDPLASDLRCDRDRCLDRTAMLSAEISGTTRLVLLPETGAGHLFSAALLRSAWRAAARPAIRELEPMHVPDTRLERFNRPTSAPPARVDAPGADSDGRWIWVVVLALLAIEALMRRPRRAKAAEVPRARVA
jgi:hypothetical protein